MTSPPAKTHTFYVSSTPTPFPSSSSSSTPSAPSPFPRSSLTHLPSLLSSTPSFSTPSFSSLQPPPSSSTTPRLPAWSAERSAASEGRRSVRWSDSRQSLKEGRGSSLSAKKTMLDPRQMWARYTQTVRPPFHLHEPSMARLGGAGGGGRRNGKHLTVDAENDSRHVVKVSLPCPDHSNCCFCVYSRQLGPVRIYFSNFRRHRLNPGVRGHRRNGKDTAQEVRETREEQPRTVLLKEPWMTSSAPSGEVVVPEFPSDVRGHGRRRQCVSKPLSDELAAAWKVANTRNNRSVPGEVRKPRSDSWFRNSAPAGQTNPTSSLFAKDSLGKLRPPRSVTFWGEGPKAWTGGDSLPRAPYSTPRTPNTLSVHANGNNLHWQNGNGKSAVRKDPRDPLGNRHCEDEGVKGPPPFPCRQLSASVRLLSKRGHRL